MIYPWIEVTHHFFDQLPWWFFAEDLWLKRVYCLRKGSKPLDRELVAVEDGIPTGVGSLHQKEVTLRSRYKEGRSYLWTCFKDTE